MWDILKSWGNESLKSSLLLKQLKTLKRRTQTLVTIKRGPVDKGCGMKTNEFIRNPRNIINAMLNPIENKIVSVILDVSILSAFRRAKPGTMMRYRETRTCRANGISKTIVRNTATWSASTCIKNFGFQLIVLILIASFSCRIFLDAHDSCLFLNR